MVRVRKPTTRGRRHFHVVVLVFLYATSSSGSSFPQKLSALTEQRFSNPPTSSNTNIRNNQQRQQLFSSNSNPSVHVSLPTNCTRRITSTDGFDAVTPRRLTQSAFLLRGDRNSTADQASRTTTENGNKAAGLPSFPPQIRSPKLTPAHQQPSPSPSNQLSRSRSPPAPASIAGSSAACGNHPSEPPPTPKFKKSLVTLPTFHIPQSLQSLSYLPRDLRDNVNVTTPYGHCGIDGYVSLVYGSFSDRGPRLEMEDAHFECADLMKITDELSATLSGHLGFSEKRKFAYFGVFDGHRGWRCSSHGKVGIKERCCCFN